MFNKQYIRAFVAILCLVSQGILADPLLVVVLMVKNEEAVINATLEPFIKEGLDAFLIFDTGSTDKTVETVTDFFKQQNVRNAYIEQEPFIDFATSRNRALELAQERFPEAVYMLMPDAEWYMHDVAGLIKFCQEHRHCTFEKIHLIKVASSNLEFYHARLMRCKSGIKFVGAVHEVPNEAACSKLKPSIYFELSVTRFGFEKSKKRWERDVAILLRAYKENPQDSRTAFYLAQTYECLNDLYNAYTYYVARSKMAGWDEENYETFFRLGRVAEALAKVDTSFTWHMAFDYYMTAFKLRPHRAEPLLKIAEHYWPDNIPACYVFARRALDLPYPENELLFVEKDMYDFTLYEVLSKCAWHVGEFELGEFATKKALKIHPEMLHLHRNLSCYKERKK